MQASILFLFCDAGNNSEKIADERNVTVDLDLRATESNLVPPLNTGLSITSVQASVPVGKHKGMQSPLVVDVTLPIEGMLSGIKMFMRDMAHSVA